MAVSILDAFVKNFANATVSVTQSLTLSGSSADNRLVIVGAILRDDASRTFSAATYGGNALTEIGTIVHPTAFIRTSLYYLKEVDLPGNGANDLFVSSGANCDDMGIWGMTLKDVNQTLLIEDFATEQNTLASSSVNLNITNRSFQVNMLGVASSGQTLTWGAGQTERWDEDIGSSRAGASSQAGESAGVEAISWAVTGGASGYAHIAASIVAESGFIPRTGGIF